MYPSRIARAESCKDHCEYITAENLSARIKRVPATVELLHDCWHDRARLLRLG